jgi:HAD superfamily hydrolase (TIGR01509 family)
VCYKAIFFDRDNTLTYADPEKLDRRNELIESWSGRPFVLGYEKTMALYDKAGYPKSGLKSVEEEIKFRIRYYCCLLEGEGIKDDLESRAQLLHGELWLKDRALYPEVIEVLEYFKTRGYKLGVISDTSPSLPLTLEALGLGKYFDCYICSDLIGVMKPDPVIYRAALTAFNVTAEESIYVDDYDVEADGARNLGFTAFHIDRMNPPKNEWDIMSLTEIVDFVKKQELLKAKLR